MLTDNTQKRIFEIWDNYIKTNKTVLDKKGNVINDIDESRLNSIEEIKKLIALFLKGDLNVYEFKTSLDSYNKRNNLWGFTATKGQMFFNQLTKTNELSIDKLTALLKQTITEPKDIKDALSKIDTLEKFVRNIFDKAKDKRKAPNPGSVGYFLSYFWQIHNNQKWPIIYTSLTTAFTELGIWKDHQTQKEDYEFFYNLNEEIKSVLKSHVKREITNWDAEHSFWNFTGKPVVVYKKAKQEGTADTTTTTKVEEVKMIKANFEIADYLIPKVAKLIELGGETDKSAAAKGSQYEKLVSEIFKQLDFEVETLGQGTGRNPDAIIKYREENTAFIIDAKAYSNGYNLGIDDRAIKEYINHYCPKLQKEGYKKIGFIIVCNSFNSNLDSFINDITWNTDIKRFILLTSEALLYLLAYKTKDKLNLSSMIESFVSFGNVVTAQNIIEEFDDI